MNDETIELLRELLTEVRGLRSDRAGRTRGVLRRTDEIKLETLLPVLVKAIGNRTFLVRELLEHAKLDLAASIALREVLASVGGSPRSIGRLLRRGVGADVGGFRIVGNGPSRDGMLWTITAITRKTRFGG